MRTEKSIKAYTKKLLQKDKTKIKALKYLKNIHDKETKDQQIKTFAFNLYQHIQHYFKY